MTEGFRTACNAVRVVFCFVFSVGAGCSEGETGADPGGSGDTAGSDFESDTDSASDPPENRDTETDSELEPSTPTVAILERDVLLEDQTVTKTVQTVLEVTWRQGAAADAVWLRFTFENDEWYQSPEKPGTVGMHREIVLGAPEQTEVTIQIMSRQGGAEEMLFETRGTTGLLPESVPAATILDFDSALASSNRWMLGSVENTSMETGSYLGPFCILIIDRKGRVVWYYLDLAWNPCMAFPRIAPSGTHIAIDRSERAGQNRRSVIRATLDFEQFEEYLTPRMADGMALTDDGSILFASTAGLHELLADGTLRQIWGCPAWAEATGAHDVSLDGFFGCYPNTVNWNHLDDSVLLSYPDISTVVEISRETGAVVGQYGRVPGGWDFLPERNELECVHGANITPEGTMLVSVREPGVVFPATPVPHFFVEFSLDRANQTATEIWSYGEGIDDFPRWKGEAYRVPGGNTLVNYGTGGIIREVTPDGRCAWRVKYDAEFEHDYNNKMVGHTILIDDLYALTRGW